MPESIILIGADEPGLNSVIRYIQDNPDSKAIVLYPELNPIPEFSCMTMERYLGRGIEFPENLRAFGIDRDNKRVRVRDNFSGAESSVPYDKLVFASGATPAELDVPGDHLSKIIRLGSYEDAARLRPIEGKTLVIGNGLNMFLATSVLLNQSAGKIEVLLRSDGSAPAPLSSDLSQMVRHHLVESGVTLHTEASLKRIESLGDGLKVITDKGDIEVSRVINASHNVAVSYLASGAGLDMDDTGGIIVDAHLRTRDPHIFACGNCASFIGKVCNAPVPGTHVKSTTPRQVRILADSLNGVTEVPLAPLSTFSLSIGDLTIAGAGLSVEAARKCGFKPMSATAIQFDRAHFMHNAELMTLELVFDADTRQVLGIQGLSKSGEALRGRISAVSAILPKHPTIEDISNLELAYSPPFASAMDVLNTVANVADNMLAGINEGIGAEEFEQIWNERAKSDDFLLDCRELGNAGPFLERHPLHWNHIPQGEIARRLEEIPRDRRIILLCNTGTRSYEAQVVLKHAGFKEVVNVDGGITAVKQAGIKV